MADVQTTLEELRSQFKAAASQVGYRLRSLLRNPPQTGYLDLHPDFPANEIVSCQALCATGQQLILCGSREAGIEFSSLATRAGNLLGVIPGADCPITISKEANPVAQWCLFVHAVAAVRPEGFDFRQFLYAQRLSDIQQRKVQSCSALYEVFGASITALGLLAPSEKTQRADQDQLDYRPAIQLRTLAGLSHQALKRILQANSKQIRTRYKGTRLFVHAGDWHAYQVQVGIRVTDQAVQDDPAAIERSH